MNLFNCFMLDIDTLLEIWELAWSKGKIKGDSCEEEFLEILKKKPDKFTYLGSTDKDIDLLCGNLREYGLKIINLKENKNE